jgi:two-component system OmpR family response regulator
MRRNTPGVAAAALARHNRRMAEPAPHILVVDDDREIRDLLARFLEKHGFRVTTARDGRELRRALPNGHYALVVLDLMLPGEDGLSLLRWLREAHGRLPVVMLTAMGEETDRIVGLELGADDYVPKPGGEFDLLRILAERAGRVLTREMLMDLLHGRSTGPFDRAIDVAVSRLRRKLDDDGKAPDLIKTVRGGGYVLAVPVERV